MAATTHVIPYDCIYAQFPNESHWGFVRRSSGNWSWCSMQILTNSPDKSLQPLFQNTIGGDQMTRLVEATRNVELSYDLFQKIFPKHPSELKAFHLAGAKVDGQFVKANELDSSSSDDEGAPRWSTFG